MIVTIVLLVLILALVVLVVVIFVLVLVVVVRVNHRHDARVGIRGQRHLLLLAADQVRLLELLDELLQGGDGVTVGGPGVRVPADRQLEVMDVAPEPHRGGELAILAAHRGPEDEVPVPDAVPHQHLVRLLPVVHLEPLGQLGVAHLRDRDLPHQTLLPGDVDQLVSLSLFPQDQETLSLLHRQTFLLHWRNPFLTVNFHHVKFRSLIVQLTYLTEQCVDIQSKHLSRYLKQLTVLHKLIDTQLYIYATCISMKMNI